MTLLRSVALATLVLAACGGSSKQAATPAEPMPAPTAPAADEVVTPVEAPAPEPAMAPAPVEEAAPAAAPPPPPAARKTRGAVKKPAKNADPCDGGE